MTRILTATVIVALLGLVLWLPWPAFVLAVVAVGLLAWREYVDLAAAIGPSPVAAPGALMVLFLILSFVAARPDAPLAALLLFTVLAAAAALREGWTDPVVAFGGLGSTLAGLIWIGLLLGCQVSLRMQPHGAIWLILLYASVAVGDSAAFYGGSRFGHRKLAPLLSPKKTIVGSVCGLAGSAIAAAVVARWLPELSTGPALALGASLGAVGQVGDLVESALKRAAGVKDSSSLLPGHGGILDRIDAHLPAGGLLFAVLRFGLL